MTSDTAPSLPVGDLPGLIPQVYDELRRIARLHLRRQPGILTLNTTAVVHEAYLKLHHGRAGWTDRPHFLALASRAMRQLLVDHARNRQADKRGGGALHVTLDEAAELPAALTDPLAIDEALQSLAAIDPVLERVVECRFFAGLSVAETALALDRSTRTIERDWSRARAYLYEALRR